ncbi:pyridoxamine 5'-phosphate oxidase family protein [Demequina sp. TTPB684]|uniref:pyridoxamine 5'-phosphate oxidase family protein n=1 Tax=unclassified Demequina TaxID=2620311 RepID=UPI001CF5322B|nr:MULTISPECIES: pyridoxamine 5'-phosphate oxidase family protein [unclassified Demequina]MCB2413832.1 pyridoxamine 5'-phosphate oxidase family protein [Demequina sp. TTPB684]UPU89144.1 pyridoxamine 5'-phosphate oxidase family protein [Demequina sp. TMPB413]
MDIDPRNPAPVAAFARQERLVVVSTVSPTGDPEAALVDIAADDEGTFFFNAYKTARKLNNLRANPKAAMVIGTRGEVSLQLEGPAYVAEGEEKAYLAAAHVAHYPGSRAEHEDFEMVVIRPTWVRHYDASTRPPTVVEVTW